VARTTTGPAVHPDDFAGRRLEDGGRGKAVHLPAVADPKFSPDSLGRRPGDPLPHPHPHPQIPTRSRRALRAWWADVKKTSSVRDWHAIAEGDPQPDVEAGSDEPHLSAYVGQPDLKPAANCGGNG
jgi:hypothetical protein